MKKRVEEYKKNITMIEVLAIVITLILILLIGSKNLNVISYEITYNGINCPTPYVVFYSNGKYEYYEFYGENTELKPKKGKYEYNIGNVLDNIDKYEENEHGPYTIKISNGLTYTTYNSNKELMELLSSSNISLERCMTYKE